MSADKDGNTYCPMLAMVLLIAMLIVLAYKKENTRRSIKGTPSSLRYLLCLVIHVSHLEYSTIPPRNYVVWKILR